MPAKETVQGLGMTYRYTSSSHRVSMSYLTNSSSAATTAQSKPAAIGSAAKTTTVYTNYAKM